MTLLLVDGTNAVMRWAGAIGEVDFDACDDALRLKILVSVTHAIQACASALNATHLIVAFDSSAASWRRELFPPYKVKRTVTTSAWSNMAMRYLTEAGIACVREAGYEADDILATLAGRAERAGRTVVVLSGDSDLLQLASLSVSVVQFGHKGEPRFVKRSLEWIRTHYEIPTAGHLGAYKALVGEPGDGLPGVPGIGPVKARKLLALADSLDDVPKLLSPAEADAYKLALTLVTLRDDVPLLPIHPADCRIT
jgi:DNA polymerase-1